MLNFDVCPRTKATIGLNTKRKILNNFTQVIILICTYTNNMSILVILILILQVISVLLNIIISNYEKGSCLYVFCCTHDDRQPRNIKNTSKYQNILRYQKQNLSLNPNKSMVYTQSHCLRQISTEKWSQINIFS